MVKFQFSAVKYPLLRPSSWSQLSYRVYEGQHLEESPSRHWHHVRECHFPKCFAFTSSPSRSRRSASHNLHVRVIILAFVKKEISPVPNCSPQMQDYLNVRIALLHNRRSTTAIWTNMVQTTPKLTKAPLGPMQPTNLTSLYTLHKLSRKIKISKQHQQTRIKYQNSKIQSSWTQISNFWLEARKWPRVTRNPNQTYIQV